MQAHIGDVSADRLRGLAAGELARLLLVAKKVTPVMKAAVSGVAVSRVIQITALATYSRDNPIARYPIGASNQSTGALRMSSLPSWLRFAPVVNELKCLVVIIVAETIFCLREANEQRGYWSAAIWVCVFRNPSRLGSPPFSFQSVKRIYVMQV